MALRLAGVRVLFVCNVDWFFVSHRLGLARALIQAGADVTVACADSGETKAIRDAGIAVIPVPFSRSGRNPLSEVRTVLLTARAVKVAAPDVIHNVTIKPVIYGTLSARVLRRKAAVINAISGFGFAMQPHAPKSTRWVVAGAYRALMGSGRISAVVQSVGARESLIAAGLFPPERLIVVHGSGIDCDRFSPAPKPGSPVIRITMAARILVDKGVLEFIEAARRIKLARPLVDFVLAGPLDLEGNPTALSQAELEISLHGSGVRYVGESRDMPALLRSTDVLVLPSYHEGLPQVLLEGAAVGLPLVATNIDGCREVVVNQWNGLLVRPRSADHLTESIMRLVDSEGLRQEYGRASRQLAVECFDERIIHDQFIGLYERVTDV